jgi:hypothetical protein
MPAVVNATLSYIYVNEISTLWLQRRVPVLYCWLNHLYIGFLGGGRPSVWQGASTSGQSVPVASRKSSGYICPERMEGTLYICVPPQVYRVPPSELPAGCRPSHIELYEVSH